MRIGRNDPCPCGSGKKYKHCHADRPDELPPDPHDGPPRRSSPIGRTSGPRKLRQCRECHACCGQALRINTPELVVAKGEPCPHLCPQGCARWGIDMPDVCKRFMCAYLFEPGNFTVNERPDKVGAIVQNKGDGRLLLAEYRAGGLRHVLGSAWGPLVRRNLGRGVSVVATFCDDPYNVEMIYAHPRNGRLSCELVACDPAGNPITLPITPVHGRQLYGSGFPGGRNYFVDAEELLKHLGEYEFAVLTVAVLDGSDAPRDFRVTRRQGEYLRALLELFAPVSGREPQVAATS